MANWDEYYKQPIEEMETRYPDLQDTGEENPPEQISDEMFTSFIERLSGKEQGVQKVVLSYKSYNMDSLESDPDREIVYTAAEASVNIYNSDKFNDLLTVDICFTDSNSTQLRMLWNNLQKFLQNRTKYPQGQWIFYFNILEKESTLNTNEDGISDVLICNLLNPIIFYLTREKPDTPAKDEEVDGQMLGGNIIRMLFTKPLVTFELSSIDVGTVMEEFDRMEMEEAMMEE